ncbi:translocase of the inner membrane [Ophidiomyces ophidiicola]|nr:translocase of the inner membrane [Ophidiomyces ophidiicola]
MDHSRDPCPWVALSDFGGAFCMGAIGGAVWHGVKGFRNSPYGERRIGAITAIKARAPVLGGNFGVWGGLFSTFDCAVKGIRKKEDPYNAIIAGFFTGGALAIRGGYKAARNSAIMCAVFLAVIEGVGIGFQRMMADNTRLDLPPPPPSDKAIAFWYTGRESKKGMVSSHFFEQLPVCMSIIPLFKETARAALGLMVNSDLVKQTDYD